MGSEYLSSYHHAILSGASQVRITVEDHPEMLKRFGHTRRARGFRIQLCLTKCPGTAHRCTQAKEHRGPHVAHRLLILNKVVAVWDSSPGPRVSCLSKRQPSASTLSTARGARRPLRRKVRRPIGIFHALLKQIRAMTSMEETVFLLFFLSFVGFAVYWLFLIMR